MSFDVVDDGGAAEETLHRGKRRLDFGEPALSLEGAQEAGFFSANVRSRASMHGEVAAKLRAQDILPQKTLRIGLLDGLLHDPVAFHELPTNVAVNGAGLDGVS